MLFQIPRLEPAIIDAIEPAVDVGVVHGGLHQLKARHPLHLRRQIEGNAAGPAVEVPDGLFAGEFSPPADGLIQVFRRRRIGLQEGVGRNPQAQTAQLLFNISWSPKRPAGFSAGHLGLFPADGMHQGGELGKFRLQMGAQRPYRLRIALVAGNQVHQGLAGALALPQHQKAPEAPMAAGVVGRAGRSVGTSSAPP